MKAFARRLQHPWIFSTVLSLVLATGLFTSLPSAQADLGCEKFLVTQSGKASKRSLEKIRELKVGTYNVENLFLHRGHHEPAHHSQHSVSHHQSYQQITPQADKPEDKVKGVANAILEMDLDIIVLQEVEDMEALRTLNSDYLSNQYIPILVEGNDPRGIDIAFLVKKDLPFEIENHSHRRENWVDPRFNPPKQGPLFSRDLPALIFRPLGAPADSKPLFVLFGAHYKSKRSFNDPRSQVRDPESLIPRTEQFKRTVQIIEQYKQEYGNDLPMLLAGDLNGNVSTEPEIAPLMTEAGLINSFDASPKKTTEQDRVSHIYFPGRGEAPEQHQVDAIMISPSLSGSVSGSEVYRYTDIDGNRMPLPATKKARDKNPSDHWPIWMTLKFDLIRQRAASLLQ